MKLNNIFSSHMVFPANKPIHIYGTGKGTGKITFAGKTTTINSDKNDWLISLEPMEYGGPYTLKAVFDDGEITLTDIYVGEVYLMSGQSNMQFKLRESNTPKEQYKGNNLLRFFTSDRIETGEHSDCFNTRHGWVIATDDNVAEFSAIGYLAGYEIAVKKGIAVGIIGCYQGASAIESWVPEGTFQAIGIEIPLEEKRESHYNSTFGKWNHDGMLYNMCLRQIFPYSLSAVVWYQGETDTSDTESKYYKRELAKMIDIWRRDFIDEELFFVIIQLANFIHINTDAWKRVQKAQDEIQYEVKGVKTVKCADVCEDDDIHPPTKTVLSHRVVDALIGQ